MTDAPLSHVLRQVDLAHAELLAYEPAEIDWHRRCVSVVSRLVPWLQRESVSLVNFVTHVMNSPADVRKLTTALIAVVKSLPEFHSDRAMQDQVLRLTEALDHEKLLLSGTGGTVISKLVEQFLIERSTEWRLESNGASDYPDLFLRSDDYSELPGFRRGKDQVYGAALKGKVKRPVRVPDGLEIKTCRRTFAVDCHHAHVGLHLVLIFDRIEGTFRTTDLLIGFMRHELYRLTSPASPTTTLKASFNGQHFVSILNESA